MNGASTHYADQRDIQAIRKELLALGEKLDTVALDGTITRRAVQSIAKHFRISDGSIDASEIALPSRGQRWQSAVAAAALLAAMASLAVAVMR